MILDQFPSQKQLTKGFCQDQERIQNKLSQGLQFGRFWRDTESSMNTKMR